MTGASFVRQIVLLALLAVPAEAQTFRLRSGEHADFSRLVLDDLPAETSWSLGRAGADYVLRLALDDAGFDTGQVFRLIPKTRLLALVSEAGALRLRVAADHHAFAFETASGALVIDIRAGSPPANSRFERSAAPSVQDTAREVTAADSPVPPREPPAASGVSGAGYRPTLEPPPRLDVFWSDQLGVASPPSPSSTVPLLAPSLPDPRVVQAEADLMMQLGRAAAQGLVEIEVPDPSARGTPPDADPASEVTAEAGEEDADGAPGGAGVPAAPQAEPAQSPLAATDPPDPAALADPAGHLAIHTETSIDRALAEQSKMAGLTSDGDACLPDAAVDLAAWGESRPFSEQLADAQATLLGEFDQPYPPAVERLVKLYLYHGFGAEAKATAAAFGLSGESSALLLTLAQILDDGHAREAGPLTGMMDCDTAAALWAVLAEERIAPGTTVDHGAVLRSFSALPLHLRRALGPGLVERFIGAGAPDTARAIRDAILRASGDHGPGLQMIDARLDLAQGDTAGAEAALGAVVQTDGPLGPEALILLIDSHLADERPVPPDLTQAAAALAFEHQDAELGPALSRAHVLALASTGAFAAASAELARAEPHWPAAPRRGVVQELLEKLVDWPDDAVFLARFFADRELFERANPPVDLRLQVAERLLKNGFAPEAAQALGSGRMVAEGRMIAARAALKERDTAQALALLAGMVGTEPAALQGEALALAGNHAAAAEAYRRADLPDRAAAEQWRAGDWEAVRGNGTDPQRAVLALGVPAGETAPPPEVPASLAGGEALLEASRAAREAWSALLAAPGPPGSGAAPAAGAATPLPAGSGN